MLLPQLMGTSGNYEIIVFGVLLVLVLQYARDGIWAFVERACRALRRKVDWADAPALPGAAAAAARRGGARRAARCARSSAAWSPSTTSASRCAAGEILGLIGPNGAGKSTTFNLVTGVLPATRGEVRLLGKRIDGLRLARDRAPRRRAHLPAREDDRRHDGARERRARRAPARPPRRAGGDAAPRPRRGAPPDAARPSGSCSASAWASSCTSRPATSRSASSG